MQETFWLLSMLKIVVLHNIYVETVIHFIFQDSQMNTKFKRNLFIRTFSNIVSVFTVTLINLMHPW